MKFQQPLPRLLAAIMYCTVLTTQAATVWDEASNGDLSNNGLAPTPLLFAVGVNNIVGTTGDSGQGIDRDYFSFTVPDGMALTALTVLGVTNVSGGSSFMGMQIGPQITVSPSGAGAANLLGYLHYGNDFIGQDLLPLLAAGYSQGLPSGAYSVWVQETGGAASYGFAFDVASVPLPGAAWLLSSSFLLLAKLRARRSRAH